MLLLVRSTWSRSQSSSDSFESNASQANESRVSCASDKGVQQERSVLWLNTHFTCVILPTYGPEAAMVLPEPGVHKATLSI